VIQIDLPATEELAGSSVALQLTSRA
jgi:hypothetical protein